MSVQAITWAFGQDIKPSARKFVLVALANYADGAGYCFPGQKKLAADTGQTDRSIRTHLKAMEDDGIISRGRRTRDDGSRTSDGYTILTLAENISGSIGVNRKKTSGQPENISGHITVSEPSVSASAYLENISGSEEGIDVEAIFERCCDLIGWHAGTYEGQRWIVSAWLAEGALPESDIYPTIEEIMTRRGMEPPEGIAYFSPAIKEARDKRENPCKGLVPTTTDERPPQSRPYETWTDDDKRECTATVDRVGRETAIRAFRYSHRQIDALMSETGPVGKGFNERTENDR